MCGQVKPEITVRHIASNVQKTFDREVTKMIRQGWLIAKKWEQYGTYFADLVLPQKT